MISGRGCWKCWGSRKSETRRSNEGHPKGSGWTPNWIKARNTRNARKNNSPVFLSVEFRVFGRSNCNRKTKRRRASQDRKSTRLNSSHSSISYAVFCLKKKKQKKKQKEKKKIKYTT